MNEQKKPSGRRVRPEEVIHIQISELEIRKRVRRGFWRGVGVGVLVMGVVTVWVYYLAFTP